MKRLNSDPSRRDPDWKGLESLVAIALKAFESTPRKDSHVLETQLRAATIAEIDFTGHGFYADLALPQVGPTLWDKTLYGGILGYASGGDERIGLNLWITDGRISCLEGFNLGDTPFTAAPAFNVEVSNYESDEANAV